MFFLDREDAGKQLAVELGKAVLQNAVILCIPRGGLVVGAELAKELDMILDLVIPRKIASPLNPEVAIGAVAQDGTTYLNEPLVETLGIDREIMHRLKETEIKEIRRRMSRYRGHEKYPDYSGMDIVITDDGVATGYTMLAAAEYIAGTMKPQRIIIAVPVSPPDMLALLEKKSDLVVCLHAPEEFYAVGQFYKDFHQNTEEEVKSILEELAGLGKLGFRREEWE